MWWEDVQTNSERKIIDTKVASCMKEKWTKKEGVCTVRKRAMRWVGVTEIVRPSVLRECSGLQELREGGIQKNRREVSVFV